MYYICSNIYIYTYLTFHTTCYFLPNKTLVVSFLSSINITNYCLLLSLLLMCALVQANLNILLDFKEKAFCYFYSFMGKKRHKKGFYRNISRPALRVAARDFDFDFFKQSDWFLKAPFSCQTQ